MIKKNIDVPEIGLNKTLETGLQITINYILPLNSLNKLTNLLGKVIEIENSPKLEYDNFWVTHLPSWFVKKSKNYTEEDLISNTQLWEFGSWVDSIKQRGWKWWEYKELDNNSIIYLETFTFPYNIDSFFYMLYCVGVDIKNIEIIEIFPNSSNLKVVK
ncbi:hypothetical protein [uncultured Croceitalea sp.]|uniref:hypothetical protein n=1 Tax=uncultured Croceitalea sp. TaxID=1798908 RepID=UPI00374F76FE